MNTEEYIASGILEAYVLGDLTEAERKDVEKQLAAHAVLREELAQIEEVHQKIIMSSGVVPKVSIKENIFNTLSSRDEENKIININPQSESLSIWKFAAAASIAVAMVSSYLAFQYYSSWKRSENELNLLIAQNTQIANDYNRVILQLDELQNEIQIIDNPNFTRVILSGTENAPEAMAAVYWNESSNEVYLRIQQMKELTANSQYQLWAIINGKPVNAGLFDGTTESALLKMNAVGGPATVFAVTIEPKGGSSSPSLETMQVAGQVVRG